MDMRRYKRFVVDKEVECRHQGARFFAFLYDLSIDGGMIEVAHDEVGLGATIQIVLSDMTTITGDVVWSIGTCRGVKFQQPIHESEVRYAGFSAGLLHFDECRPKDRFGRELPPLPLW